MNSGVSQSLLSAFLFGVSPVFVKLIMGETSPVLLAGLLYLGSGIGLHVILLLKRQQIVSEIFALSRKNRVKLLGSIVAGGVLAPLCLLYGIQLGTVFEVSLLLNLEAMVTTVLAWILFHESVGRRVWIGCGFLLLGGMIVSWDSESYFGFSQAGLFLLAACIFWGIDNNLTRDVEEISPAILGSLKGWVAGGFNTLLAVVMGQFSIGWIRAVEILSIGAMSYGLSLVLFVNALRLLGAARTSAYFSMGPFWGMLFSLLLLGELPTNHQWISVGVMALGIWVLYREQHIHLHVHEQITHCHRHTHDEHHQHLHDTTVDSKYHEHLHTHEPLTHTHVHWPDIHHRHRH